MSLVKNITIYVIAVLIWDMVYPVSWNQAKEIGKSVFEGEI